jgi:hypothetical protein
MDFEYRGVTAEIPEEMLSYNRDYMGIEIPTLLKTSIDRMLYVSENEIGDFAVGVHVLNPSCDVNSCGFHIKVFRV